MRKALRSFELIYRLGGEEFLVVLPGANLEEGLLVAERLRQTIEEVEPGGLKISASFGVSAGDGEGVVYDRLFKTADQALYDAKAAGRNCVMPVAAEPAPDVSPRALSPVG
jgi:diguanylate cyclase (GGDEF)-like protein